MSRTVWGHDAQFGEEERPRGMDPGGVIPVAEPRGEEQSEGAGNAP